MPMKKASMSSSMKPNGAHLGFHRDLPAEALACGADCVAQSTRIRWPGLP